MLIAAFQEAIAKYQVVENLQFAAAVAPSVDSVTNQQSSAAEPGECQLIFTSAALLSIYLMSLI